MYFALVVYFLTPDGLFYRIRLYTVRLASSGDGGAQVLHAGGCLRPHCLPAYRASHGRAAGKYNIEREMR
eukprot:scaffold15846_cov75-Phaeocystis_antarctica.AAC.2